MVKEQHSSVGRAVRGCALALLVAIGGVGAAAQAPLPDGSSVVVTQDGLFLVPVSQAAIFVAGPAAFGGGMLELPSVTWITGSNSFVVTRRNQAGLGGVWRVELQASGAASITDLTPAIPAAFGRDFVDADYSVGLDTLFLLERSTGLVLALPQPLTSTGASMVPWGSVAPGTGASLAVRGAKQPFSVLVVTLDGDVLAVNQQGSAVINASGNGSWTQVSTNPVSGGYFLASQSKDKIVIAKEDLPNGLPQALISLNVWGFCGPLAPEPLDIVYDGGSQRVVALAGDFVPDCAFGQGVATGKNHLLRLPVTAGGPPSAGPKLLSGTGGSGIDGPRGDLALVRYGLADITWVGTGSPGAGSSAPVFSGADPFVLGQAALQELSGAPPSAPAFLVAGLTAVGGQVQGQFFGPFPQWLLPTATDANGKASLLLAIPSISALGGKRLYLQWWINDTTTPASGDLASSQMGILTVGTP